MSSNSVEASPRSAGIGLEHYLPGRKTAQGHGRAWRGLDAQIFVRPAIERGILVPAVIEPLVVFILQGNAVLEERELDGPWTQSPARAGTLYLTHADRAYHLRWHTLDGQPFEVLQLYLGAPLLETATNALGLDARMLKIADARKDDDALATATLAALASELRAGEAACPLFVQSLATSLTVHLLRQHAARWPTLGGHDAKLPNWKLIRAIDYMDRHIADAFDLQALADVCGMSRSHFSRAFHGSTGQPPSRWFIARRIDISKSRLVETSDSITDIALSVGYDNPGHFSQVFRKLVGVRPSAYRSA